MGLRGVLVLLGLLWGRGLPFELQEALQELQRENARLHGHIQNLSDALSDLKLLLWDHAQDLGASAEHLHRSRTPCHLDTPHPSAAPHPGTPHLGLLGGALLLGALAVHAALWELRGPQDLPAPQPGNPLVPPNLRLGPASRGHHHLLHLTCPLH